MTHGWFMDLLLKALLQLPLPTSDAKVGPAYFPPCNTAMTTVHLVAPTPEYPEWSMGLLEHNAMPHFVGRSELIFGSTRGPITSHQMGRRMGPLEVRPQSGSQ